MAVALSKHADLHIDLYEAADQFSEIGAGVMFWARTWKVLSLLGLAEDLSKVTATKLDTLPSACLRYRVECNDIDTALRRHRSRLAIF